MDGGHWSEEARQVGVPELPEWSLGRQQTSVASQHGPKAGSSGLKCKWDNTENETARWGCGDVPEL